MITTLRNIIKYNSIILEAVNFTDAKAVFDAMINKELMIPKWDRNALLQLQNIKTDEKRWRNLINFLQWAIDKFNPQEKIKFVKYYLQKFNNIDKLRANIIQVFNDSQRDAWKAFIQYKDTPNKPPELQEKFNNFLNDNFNDYHTFEHEVLSWRSGKTKTKTGPVNINNIQILQGSFKGSGWFVFIPKNYEGARQFSYIKKPSKWPYKKNPDENDNEVHPRWCTVLSKHYFDTYSKGTLYSCINYNEGKGYQFYGIKNNIKGGMDTNDKFFLEMQSADQTDDTDLKYIDSIIKEKGITNETKEKIFGESFLKRYNEIKDKIEKNLKEYKPFKKEANNFLKKGNDYKINSIILTPKINISTITKEYEKEFPDIDSILKRFIPDKDIAITANNLKAKINIKKNIIHIISSKEEKPIKKYYCAIFKKERNIPIYAKYTVDNKRWTEVTSEETELLNNILARKRLIKYQYKENVKTNNGKKYDETKDGIKYMGYLNRKEISHIFSFPSYVEIKLDISENDNVNYAVVKTNKIQIRPNYIGYRKIDIYQDSKLIDVINEKTFKAINSELWNKLIHFKKYKQALKDTYIEHNPFSIVGNSPQDQKETLRHILEDVALVKFKYQGKNSHDKYPQVLAIDPKYVGRDFWKNKDPKGYLMGINTNYSKNKKGAIGNTRDIMDFAELLNNDKLQKYKRLNNFLNDEIKNLRTYLRKNIKFMKKMKDGEWIPTNFEEIDKELKSV
jgi:hypothetical protein